MKKLSTYLFLILFSFQTPSWADDIRDFQIEGMSVGDSLLDYFSEEQIKNQKQKTQYPGSDKFIIYTLSKNKWIMYCVVFFADEEIEVTDCRIP